MNLCIKVILNNAQPSDRLHNLFEPLLYRLDANTAPTLRNQVTKTRFKLLELLFLFLMEFQFIYLISEVNIAWPIDNFA